MAETSINDLSNVTFAMNNIPPSDTLKFQISMIAKMEAFDYQNEGNVFINIIDISFNEGNSQKTSNAYNLYYPVISITKISISKTDIVPLSEKRLGSSKKPAKLYMFSKDIYEKTSDKRSVINI